MELLRTKSQVTLASAASVLNVLCSISFDQETIRSYLAIPFFLSFFIAIIVQQKHKKIEQHVGMAILNGAVIFAAAFGTSHLGHHAEEKIGNYLVPKRGLAIGHLPNSGAEMTGNASLSDPYKPFIKKW